MCPKVAKKVSGTIKIPRYIWAFDPGLHCGWAIWGRQDGLLACGEPLLRGPSDCARMLDEMTNKTFRRGLALKKPFSKGNKDFLIGSYPEVVVYEDFRLRPQLPGRWGSSVGLSPVYVAAWIQGMLMSNEYSGAWAAQMPGERDVIKNVYLRELGWWQRGSLGHSHDAMRHLLVYLRKQRIMADGSRM